MIEFPVAAPFGRKTPARIQRTGVLLPCALAIAATIASLWTAASAPGAPPEGESAAARGQRIEKLFDRGGLAPWCIVPFDALRRGPAARTEMLKELKLARCAYDWRAEDVPGFEEEILQYKRRGIEFFAFWSVHEEAFRLFEKHGVRPQIWQTLSSPAGETQEARVAAAVAAMLPLAERTAQLKCKLGLYNHGGWGGEPDNLVAVCRALREAGHAHVGIVYNFHHGHGHIADWAESFQQLHPYLWCLNINGMNDNAAPKILALGRGRRELEMLRVVVDAGYDGPIGILDHQADRDTRVVLEENLEGLQWLVRELKSPGSGGPRPPPAARPAAPPATAPPATAPPTASSHSHGGAGEAVGRLFPGREAYSAAPLTIDVQCTLHGKNQYHILAANHVKQSASHWELFAMNGSGYLTAYFPGMQPDHVTSSAQVADGRPHRARMIYEPERVRLYLDDKLVAEQPVSRQRNGAAKGLQAGLGIGRLVEGGLAFQGTIAAVRLWAGAYSPTDEPTVEPVGDWSFEPAGLHAPGAGAAHNTGLPLPYDAAWVEAFSAEAGERGDANRGAAVFADVKLACVSCHRVGEHGGQVGPPLTEIGRERKVPQLIESLFWPQRDVKPEYQAWSVATSDGSRWRGYQVSESPESLVLKEPSGKTVTLSKGEIERVTPSGTLMPDGLLASLSRQQQLDLVRFLAELGRGSRDWTAAVEATLAHAHFHGAVKFPVRREPLHPEDWPSWQLPVNRDRIYDFYGKQAEHFRGQHPTPALLTEFPGLDGGEQGHWGNQDEAAWADGRWNDTILGSAQCGVFRGGGRTVARGVCVQLGAPAELACCFNIDTLGYELVWKGGFVRFSSVRHGFLNGLEMAGQVVSDGPTAAQLAPLPGAAEAQYLGFHRIGRLVAFAYRIGDVEYLDCPMLEAGQFRRIVAPADSHPLRARLGEGERQWPQVVETRIVPGGLRPPSRDASAATPHQETHQEPPYVVDTIELPTDNPWKALLFCGGHDFLSTGEAVVCTMHGDVWRVSGLDGGTQRPGTARWTRFASGLHHALGLVVADDEVYVQCRDQLVRLRDLNRDGEADFYECFSKAFETSSAGHDFICGLERDSEGNFYTASGNQGLLRISADGRRAVVLATGFRNPDGLGRMPDGSLTVPCSEGSWTPASMVCSVPPSVADAAPPSPPYYGFGGPRDGQPPALPLVYLPRGLDNSSGGQTWVDSARWGPLQGQSLHLSFGAGAHFLLLRDTVQGQAQGAVVPLPGEFLSGAHRGRFRAQDGQLYVTGMAGWGSYTPEDGCFQRVRYTGQTVALPESFHVFQNGVRIRFTAPLEASLAGDAASHFAQCWNYRYSLGYGSPEFSARHPGARGHDPLTVSRALLLDERTLFLEIPDLQPVNQLHLWLQVDGGRKVEMFVTVHQLDEPLTTIPGYRPTEKVVAAHPILSDLALATKRVPNPYARADPDARPIRLETGKNLTFATRTLRAGPGESLRLTLVNPDVVPHNWALVEPDALQEVGLLANRLIADPEAVARHYIPDTKRVLAYTDIVQAGEEFTIYFKAPDTPGRFPYLCTFPGHWMVMNGELIVE